MLKWETYYFHRLDLTPIFEKDIVAKEAATHVSLHSCSKEIKQRRKHESDVPTQDEGPEQTYQKAWPSDPGKARDDLKQQLMHALLKSEQPVYNAQNVRNDEEKAEG